MRNDTKIIRYALATLVSLGGGLLTIACGPVNVEGESGNLEFGFPDATLAEAFNTNIAVGAKADIRVREATEPNNDTPSAASVQTASSDNPDVMSATLDDTPASDVFTVEALSDGDARIEVEADTSGGTVSDAITLQAMEPDSLTLNHLCGPEDPEERLYLAGTDILVRFGLSAGEEALDGYGLYPVELDPASSAEIIEDVRDRNYIHLEAAQTIGEVTVNSQIDDTSITLTTVDPADISDIQVDDTIGGGGGTVFARVRPLIRGDALDLITGATPVCQSTIRPEISVVSTDVCDARFPDGTGDDDIEGLAELLNETPNSRSLFIMEAKSEGSCEVEVTYPMADGGSGVTTTVTADVKPDA